MKVVNVHEGLLPASGDDVGSLIESFGQPGDRLWPWETWPVMRHDAGLAEGDEVADWAVDDVLTRASSEHAA